MRACISKDGYVARHYRTCRIIRAKRPSIIKPESAEKVRALLKANAAISCFTKGGSHYVMNHVTFTHFRRQDAKIDLLAARVIAGAQTRTQKLRWGRVRNHPAPRKPGGDGGTIIVALSSPWRSISSWGTSYATRAYSRGHPRPRPRRPPKRETQGARPGRRPGRRRHCGSRQASLRRAPQAAD
jgi:hypothetical protein